MKAEDVTECVELVASVPSARGMYGGAIRDLPAAWLRLLECEAKTAVVFEEVYGLRRTICAIGVSVFVDDAFVDDLKSRPLWVAPELARRLRQGQSPLLTSRQLREANSRGGLTCLVWEGRFAPKFEEHWEAHSALVNAFVETHRGFLWKELIAHQAETVKQLQWNLRLGGMLWNPVAGCYTDSVEGNLEEVVRYPHLLGLTRDLEMRRPGTWAGSLFNHRPPTVGFSPTEQRLLLSASRGSTDQELSDDFGVSLDTIKKTWRMIYQRAAECLPEFAAIDLARDDGDYARGREKRRRLLAYLREYPEELRPTSRKVLNQNAAPAEK